MKDYRSKDGAEFRLSIPKDGNQITAHVEGDGIEILNMVTSALITDDRIFELFALAMMKAKEEKKKMDGLLSSISAN